MSNELPALTGSPKQIAWAEKIRPEVLERVQTYVERVQQARDRDVTDGRRASDQADLELRGLNFALQLVEQRRDASFWIDKRNACSPAILESQCLESHFSGIPGFYAPEKGAWEQANLADARRLARGLLAEFSTL